VPRRPDNTIKRLVIRAGRIIDPANGLDEVADLFIDSSKVIAVGRPPARTWTPEEQIDARNKIVCPGLVDLCAHLREPGQEQKANIQSETHAAAAGGITTLCCPPDTDPVIDTPAVAELIRHQAGVAGYARVLTLGALTQGLHGERLSEMAALKTAGCPGVSNARRPIKNTLVERRAMEYAATFGLTVFLHAEDPFLANGGCAHEGAIATRMGLPAIPAAAETAAVARDLALIEQTGVRAHFCRLTTARSIQMVARAQYDGLPITADVAIPYLFLSENDIVDFDGRCHVAPPFRTQRDREALRAGIARGTLSAICSDHQPHEPDAKLAPFPDTEPGISGLDTLLSLTLRLVDDNVLTLAEGIERLTSGPARILRVAESGLGSLSVGAPADVIVVDPQQSWFVQPDRFLSAGHNTPFAGWELPGRVTHTLLNGSVVYCHS
jgi:dihydroorotase